MNRICQKNKRTDAFALRVLGCKVNAYEAQQIRRRLELNGMHQACDGEVAEVVVVHTCAVTSMAVKKSRQTVRSLQKKHPNARVVVTGCAASEDLLLTVQGVHARIPQGEGWLSDFQDEVKHISPVAENLSGGSYTTWDGTSDHLQVDKFHSHSRAFLKIQDGCDIGCSFCIVPRLRRAPRDKPLDVIEREAFALGASGHREIVISGVSVGLYGRDGNGPNLAGVLRKVSEVPGIERIRLSSLHPHELTNDLLDVWASSPKFLPHIHLPLQSGSDRILRAMKRGYSSGEFLDAVYRAQDRLENPAISADVIVGFPGETEEDFAETVALSREVRFSRMHIFPYSVRPHTRAARMKEQVSSEVSKNRCRRLQKVAHELSFNFHRSYAGREVLVLTEEWDPGIEMYKGYSERYIPVRFKGPTGLTGQNVPVWVRKAESDGVVADWSKNFGAVSGPSIDVPSTKAYVPSI